MSIEIPRIQTSKATWAESRPILRGIGLILLATGVALLAIGTYIGAGKYRRIRAWLPADALVLEFHLVNEPHGRVMSDYRAHFTFQYEVGGRTIVSSTQSENTSNFTGTLKDWTLNYRLGNHQQIRYNPAHSEEVTIDNLDVRSFRQPLWLASWGTGLLLIGLGFRSA